VLEFNYEQIVRQRNDAQTHCDRLSEELNSVEQQMKAINTETAAIQSCLPCRINDLELTKQELAAAEQRYEHDCETNERKRRSDFLKRKTKAISLSIHKLQTLMNDQEDSMNKLE